MCQPPPADVRVPPSRWKKPSDPHSFRSTPTVSPAARLAMSPSSTTPMAPVASTWRCARVIETRGGAATATVTAAAARRELKRTARFTIYAVMTLVARRSSISQPSSAPRFEVLPRFGRPAREAPTRRKHPRGTALHALDDFADLDAVDRDQA